MSRSRTNRVGIDGPQPATSAQARSASAVMTLSSEALGKSRAMASIARNVPPLPQRAQLLRSERGLSHRGRDLGPGGRRDRAPVAALEAPPAQDRENADLEEEADPAAERSVPERAPEEPRERRGEHPRADDPEARRHVHVAGAAEDSA